MYQDTCGAPITSVECQYCGTLFYDFATIKLDKPTYLRFNAEGRQFTCKAIMRSCSIYFDQDMRFHDDPITERMIYKPIPQPPTINMQFETLMDDRGIYLIERKYDE